MLRTDANESLDRALDRWRRSPGGDRAATALRGCVSSNSVATRWPRRELRAVLRTMVSSQARALVPSSPRNPSKYLSARRQASCTMSSASCAFRVR